MRRDEADVQSLIQLMETNWLSPFSPEHGELVSLSTAAEAPSEVAKDLLEVYKVGEEAYQTFMQERLQEDVPSMQFHEKVTKTKLKTFSDIRKKSCSLKADRRLFGQMVIIAESRKLQMRDVLAHPLGPLPWALANGDGSLHKTNKTALARELEKNVSPAEEIPEPSATIIDGMSVVQKLKENDQTFLQLAESALSHVLHEGSKSRHTDIVFDVNREMSIKDAEQSNRGSDMGIQLKNIAPGHKIQQ